MRPNDLLEIERLEAEGGVVLVVRGELDLTSVSQLEEAVERSASSCLILDLGGLDFIDSAGMRMIDQVQRRLHDSERSLLVVAPSESRAAWAFRVAGFTDGFALESVELALARAARAEASA